MPEGWTHRTGGMQRTRECFKDKTSQEGWEGRQNRRRESNRPKSASFPQRVMLDMKQDTQYLAVIKFSITL